MISNAVLQAKELLKRYGIKDITTLDLADLAYANNALVIEAENLGADGRTIFGNQCSLIKINKNIPYPGKKRFTLAHEIGHLILHKNVQPLFLDDDSTLEYFKKGHQESEANEFAAELLMPEVQFKKECDGKKFSPELLRTLAEKFQTSITSVAYKYFEHGNHPVCLIYSFNNIVRYWKRPEGYNHFLIDYTKLSPPEGSVAFEFFTENKIYPKHQSKQQIWKSTWFDMKHWEDDNNYKFYEYCIITPKHNTVLSVVWEELR
jgi:Zn-dependent peptidase ImmA (M78 family)